MVRDLARKLENQSLLMMRMRLLEMLLLVLKRRKRKKKKRRRKNKYFSLLEHFSSYKLKPLIVHNKLCNSQCNDDIHSKPNNFVQNNKKAAAASFISTTKLQKHETHIFF